VVVDQRESLDVRDGQFEVLGEFAPGARGSVFSRWIFSNLAATGSESAGAGERCWVSSVMMSGKCRRKVVLARPR
jgi:hypothetical protein